MADTASEAHWSLVAWLALIRVYFQGVECVLLLVQVKGNVYKNKRVLMEAIHKQKAEKIREKAIADQFEARRAKNKTTRERKIARREERLTSVRPFAHLTAAGPTDFLSELHVALFHRSFELFPLSGCLTLCRML